MGWGIVGLKLKMVVSSKMQPPYLLVKGEIYLYTLFPDHKRDKKASAPLLEIDHGSSFTQTSNL
jgi:hypothetical protein